MSRLAWGLLVIGAACLAGVWLAADILIHAPSSLILRALRRRQDRYDQYWFGPYNPDATDEGDISAMLAAIGAEVRAGCTCEGCEHIRATAAGALFRITADDIAELDRIGITWEMPQPTDFSTEEIS